MGLARVVLTSMPRALADIEARDWSGLTDLGIEDLTQVLIAVFAPALQPFAGVIAGMLIYARHHPADTLSDAMLRAAGPGGGAIGDTSGIAL